jgi:hypothetical protein
LKDIIKTDNNTQSANKFYLEDKVKDRSKNTSGHKKKTRKSKSSEQKVAGTQSSNKFENSHNNMNKALEWTPQVL